jgi:hypothetical protein
MDLQAILDAPSSSYEDSDVENDDAGHDCYGGGAAAAIGKSRTTTTPVVVAVGGGGDRRPPPPPPTTRNTTTRAAGVGGGGGDGIRRGVGAAAEDMLAVGERPDVVDRILLRDHRARRESNASRVGGGAFRYHHRGSVGGLPPSSSSSASANLELERILMEADNDDDDDGDEESCRNNYLSAVTNGIGIGGGGKGSGGGSNAPTSASSKDVDYLLQSIIDEGDDNVDDDDDDDDEDDDEDDVADMSNSFSPARRRNDNSNAGGNKGGIAAAVVPVPDWRNPVVKSNNAIPSSHSFEVDAILNSIQDDDDDEEEEDDYGDDYAAKNYRLDLSKYHRSTSSSSCSAPHRTFSVVSANEDGEDDGENDIDFGLNFNYGAQDAIMYGDGNIISSIMQHPLSRKDGGQDARTTTWHHGVQKEVYIHNSKQQRREDRSSSEYSFYDSYTADENFLNRSRVVDDGGKEKASAGRDANRLGDRRQWQQQRQEDERDDDDDDDDDDNNNYDEDGVLLSRRRMQHAENAERKLLRPSGNNAASNANNSNAAAANAVRNVVSPLAVKRRMKPRVELMTKSRSSSWQTQGGVSSGKQQHQHQHQHQQQQQPRFGFSGGIIQTKSILSVPLGGSSLLSKKDGSGANNRTPNPNPLPTALAVNSKFIALGNQRGEVRVFDLYEQLKIILGRNGTSGEGAAAASAVGGKRNDAPATAATASVTSSSASSNFGSVTSIDLSSQGDFLVAGYGTGQVILWDVIKGAILKIVDSHSSSICSARFTHTPMAGESGRRGMIDNEKIGAVIVDAGGLVNKLIFSRGWLSAYSVETECLLDGTAGQILAMDVLSTQDMTSMTAPPATQQTTATTPFDNRIVLIALSSSRSSFAVSVEPKVIVLHRWARPSSERIDPTIGDDDRLTQTSSCYASTYASSNASSSYLSTSTYQSTVVAGRQQEQQKRNVDATPVPYLPCLSWGWALVCGGGHSITPILARAWGCCLQFLRASSPPSIEDDENNNSATVGDDNAAVATVHWPAFGTHDEFDASAPVVALNWLGKRSLVYLTITNEFIIIDTVIMTMQERLDFSGMKLIYAEFALSRPPPSASSRFRQPNSNDCTTFMNSIRSSDNRLLVLCQGDIKEITALGMRQQIMSLEDGGQWLEALALALDHYESSIKSQEDNKRNVSSSALKSLDVMTRSNPSLLTEDEVWMAELLMRYLILAIDNAPDSSPMGHSFSINKIPNRLNLAESHFEMLSGKAMSVGRPHYSYISCFSLLRFCLFITFAISPRSVHGVLHCHKTA